MEEINIFSNEEFGEIRTVIIDGEPWLVGKDVATALGYRDAKKALRTHVDGEDKMGGAIRPPIYNGQIWTCAISNMD